MSELLTPSHKPFTPRSLAARWDVTPRTVYRMLAKGQLRGFRVGGKTLRISADEVAAWESGDRTTSRYYGANASGRFSGHRSPLV